MFDKLRALLGFIPSALDIASWIQKILAWARDYIDPAQVRRAADILQNIDSDDEGLDDFAARVLHQLADWLEAQRAAREKADE